MGKENQSIFQKLEIVDRHLFIGEQFEAVLCGFIVGIAMSSGNLYLDTAGILWTTMIAEKRISMMKFESWIKQQNK